MPIVIVLILRLRTSLITSKRRCAPMHHHSGHARTLMKSVCMCHKVRGALNRPTAMWETPAWMERPIQTKSPCVHSKCKFDAN